MRFAVYHSNDRRGLAVDLGAGFRGLFQDESGYPGGLEQLIGSHADLSLVAGALACGTAIDPEAVQLLPPLPNPGKIICIGLNYVDHSAEVGIALPDYPTVFARFSSSLIGHAAPVAVPRQTIQFDLRGRACCHYRPRRPEHFS